MESSKVLDELEKWKEKFETEHKRWKKELETKHMKKTACRLEYDRALEKAALPKTETEIKELAVTEEAVLEALPVIEAEVPSEEVDKERQKEKTLELRITELENMFALLQTELNTYVNKKKSRKKGCKKTKDKCKCIDKKM